MASVQAMAATARQATRVFLLLALLLCAVPSPRMLAQARGCPYAQILSSVAGIGSSRDAALPPEHPDISSSHTASSEAAASNSDGPAALAEATLSSQGHARQTKQLLTWLFAPYSTYNPKRRDWSSVISACKAAGDAEKRMNAWFIRMAAHDALTVDPTCGSGTPGCGGADASFTTMAELMRPENTYDDFGNIATRVVMKIAQAYKVSAADVIAVCGAVGMKQAGGPDFFRGLSEFRVGRRDTWSANPSGQLLPANATALQFASYFKARGLTAAEGVALIGSHALIDEQACFRGRNNNPADHCNPTTEACADVRMFSGAGPRFYVDACTPTLGLLNETEVPPGDREQVFVDEAEEVQALNELEYESMMRSELCKFTSTTMRGHAMANLEAMRTGVNRGRQVVKEAITPTWDAAPATCAASTYAPIRANCAHPNTWWYTINDAHLGRACQGLGGNTLNADIVAIKNAMLSYITYTTWSNAYRSAYMKMVNLGVKWATLLPVNIHGRECYSGYHVDSPSALLSGINSFLCNTLCMNGDSLLCPPDCRCRTAFINGMAWFVDAVADGTPVGSGPAPPPGATPLPPDPLADTAGNNPPGATDLVEADTMPSLQPDGKLAATPPSPYGDQTLEEGTSPSLCPPSSGGPYSVQGFPGTPFPVVPFQELFVNPPVMATKGTACRGSGDSHCLNIYEVNMTDFLARPWDKTIPGCATKPATRFLGYGGRTPGPTLLQPAGHESAVHFVNRISGNVESGQWPCTQANGRSGRPTSIHHHGSASLAPWDGWAEDVTCGGEAKTYVWPHQRPNTGWYHDHALHITSDNAYRGLAGFSIVSDKFKHGGCGEPYNMEDMPELHLMLADKVLDSNCQLLFDHSKVHRKNMYGDINLVSGIPWPLMNLQPKWYRMRLLNGATSRPYLVKIKDDTGADVAPTACFVIGGDGGYRASPVPFPSEGLLIGIAERYEAVCDLRAYAGRTLYLWNGRNRKLQKNVPYFCYSHLLAKIVVAGAASNPQPVFDPSITPAQASPVFLDKVLSPADYEAALALAKSGQATRTMKFGRRGGQWTINGETWHSFKIAADDVGQNTWEVWKLETGGGWFHPVHVHLVDLYMLRREGYVATPNGLGTFAYEQMMPKDVVYLGPGQTLYLLARFGPHKGQYMFHCHNLVHEDDDMLRAFQVVEYNRGRNPSTVQQFTVASGVLYDRYELQDPTVPGARPVASWPIINADYASRLLLGNYYRIFYPLLTDTTITSDGIANPWKARVCALPPAATASATIASEYGLFRNAAGAGSSAGGGSGSDAPADSPAGTGGSDTVGVMDLGEGLVLAGGDAPGSPDNSADGGAAGSSGNASRPPAPSGGAPAAPAGSDAGAISPQDSTPPGGGSDAKPAMPLPAAIAVAAVGGALLAAAVAVAVFTITNRRRRSAVLPEGHRAWPKEVVFHVRRQRSHPPPTDTEPPSCHAPLSLEPQPSHMGLRASAGSEEAVWLKQDLSSQSSLASAGSGSGTVVPNVSA